MNREDADFLADRLKMMSSASKSLPLHGDFMISCENVCNCNGSKFLSIGEKNTILGMILNKLML